MAILILVLTGALSLAGCGVVYNSLPLTADPSSVSFGSVQVGKSSTATVTLHNESLKPVSFTGVQSDDAAFVSIASASTTTIPSGGSATVQIVFKPGAAKSYSSHIVVSSNSGQTSFGVSGTGAESSSGPSPSQPVTASLTVSTTTLQFGSVPIGGESQQTVTVSSSGTGPLTINSLHTSGSGFSAKTPGLPVTLKPGQSLSLPVSFNPAASGSASGKLVIGSDASTQSSVTVALVGSGASSGTGSTTSTPALTLSSSSVNFGSVAVGSHANQSVTLTSSGTATVEIQSLAVKGSPFTAGQLSLPLSLAPGQQVTLPLTFTPTATGAQQGQITLADNTAAGSATINLSGTGTASSTSGASSSTLSVPSSVNFGDVTTGSSGSKTLTLVASGMAPVTIKAIAVTGSGFSASALSLPQVLQPNQQMSVRLSFAPGSDGSATGSVKVTSDATTDPSASAVLQGNGVAATAPALTASATTLSFGKVAVNSTATQTLTVTSTGTAPAIISAGTLSGTGYSATYAGVGIQNLASSPVTVQPGQKAVFEIAFDPTKTGASTGQFSLATNTGSPINVSLSGQGISAGAPAVTLSASSLDFGQVEVGQKGTQQLTVTSSGTAPLTLSSQTLAGTGFNVASVTYPSGSSALPVTLNPGQQVVLTIGFSPNAVASFTGSLALTTNASGGTVNVPLTGVGEAVPVAGIQLSSTSVSFGSVPVGTSASKQLTITSNGSAALTITAIAVSGTQFSSQNPTLPVTLQPGQTLSLPLTYTPDAEGAATGTVTVTSNAAGGAVSATLGGTGTATATPQLTVSPTSLSFGSVAVDSSGTQTLTLTSSGTASVTITSANVTGSGFSVTGQSFPLTLSAGKTATLQVAFAPTAAGTATGTLTLASNASGGTTTVQLSGTGTAATTTTPQLQVSATSLAFGNVNVGSTATLNLTLVSSGTAPVTISSLGITGTGFSESGGSFPLTLNPSQSVTIEVQFDPTAAGAATGTLTIASNSGTGATAQVAITGTGTAVQHYVDLNWNAPSSTSDPATGYNIYRSADNGTTFTRLNSSPDADVTYTDNAVESGTTYLYQVTAVDASGVESTASNQITLTIP